MERINLDEIMLRKCQEDRRQQMDIDILSTALINLQKERDALKKELDMLKLGFPKGQVIRDVQEPVQEIQET